MKILCAFYICVMLTFEGARLTPTPWQQQQHLSRKLNRDEPPQSSSLQPAGEQHHHPTADDDDDDDLYSRRGCQQSPANKCLRRADKLPDHIAKLHHPQWRNSLPSLRKLSSIRWRSKREARAPAYFLPRYHLRHYPSRNRRKVIRHRREGFGRRDHRRRRRRKRKRKRSQPGEIVVTSLSPPVTVQPSELITNENLAPTPIPSVAEAHSTPKEDTSSHVVFTVASCLLLLIVSGVLLFYLYNKSRRKPGFDPFYCPPEPGQLHNRDDNPSDMDRCTCCSSEKRASPPRLSEPKKQQQRTTKSTVKVRETKKATKPVKKKLPTGRKFPAKQPPPFSETELREIQSKIACILRHDCARCTCCKCNAVDAEEDPKRSKKFKFFNRKNKPSTAATLCSDTRCDENKIRCLVNLCRASDTGGLRIKQ